MSNQNSIYFTTPVGRYVSGSIDKPITKDNSGNPLIIKRGVDAGKPTQKFDFGLAVPKGRETHWKETSWGEKVYSAALKSWPNGQHASPLFSWKIIDGDSTVPNTRGKKPCDSEGYKGHWVIYFSSNQAPKTVNNTGTSPIDSKSIKKGDWIQVAGSTKGNDQIDKPGMYMNHNIVSFQWAGDPIMTGPDTSQMGFGATPAPAGVSTTPTGLFVAPAPIATPPVVTVAAPPVVPTTAAAPTPVVPHTAILSPPPAMVGPVMTAKANGAKYEDFVKNGWTRELLIEHGYMVAA